MERGIKGMDTVNAVPDRQRVFNYEVLLKNGNVEFIDADRINIGMSGSLELFDDWGLVKAYTANVWSEVTRIYAK
jgi:hypothetical protein